MYSRQSAYKSVTKNKAAGVKEKKFVRAGSINQLLKTPHRLSQEDHLYTHAIVCQKQRLRYQKFIFIFGIGPSIELELWLASRGYAECFICGKISFEQETVLVKIATLFTEALSPK